MRLNNEFAAVCAQSNLPEETHATIILVYFIGVKKLMRLVRRLEATSNDLEVVGSFPNIPSSSSKTV